jgi:hypothetical protein
VLAFARRRRHHEETIMNDTNFSFLDGQLFLYQQPELLTRETHEGLGVSPTETPHAHSAAARALPLTLTEFTTAQKFFPIVFTSLEKPVPLAVVSIVEDANLFIDDQGRWDPLCYVPAYLRCHPFAFAQQGEDKLAVVIDRASSEISATPQYPFFDGDDISEYTRQRTQFSARFQGERRRTEEFCQQLVELGLLTGQHVTHALDGSAEPQVLANYVSIDAQRLNDLDKDVLHDLHTSGRLAAMYAQVASTENWSQLLARRRRRQG